MELAKSFSPDGFPTFFDAHYHVYQGETDVTSLIQLGGKGQYTEGRDATRNWDEADGEGKVTFEDIDGFEVVEDNGKVSRRVDRLNITLSLTNTNLLDILSSWYLICLSLLMKSNI